MPTFEEVVACVRGERAYQETRWQRPAHNHSLTEYLVFIDHYVKNAMAIVSKEDGDKGSLDDFRKIAALAFAAMEENGCKNREYPTIRRSVLGPEYDKPYPPQTYNIPWNSLNVECIPDLPDFVFDPTPPGNIEPRPEPCSCHSILAKDVSTACPVHKETTTFEIPKTIEWVKSFLDKPGATVDLEEDLRTQPFVIFRDVLTSEDVKNIYGYVLDVLNLAEAITGVQPKTVEWSDGFAQGTQAIQKTPSPCYVIHKCSRAGCGKHLFFYDDGVDHLPDAIVDHYLDDHSFFAWAITAGLIPLHTQLTEFVREL